MRNLLASLFLSFLFFSCATDTAIDPFSKVKNEDAKALLQKAMDAAGGLENWNNKKELHFSKYFVLYDSSGNTENSVTQMHKYLFDPKEDIYIDWVKNGQGHQIHYTDGKAEKMIGGANDPDAKATSTMSSVRSAMFVMNIPFNFLDEGAELSYDGSTVLDGGEQVEILKIVYRPEQYDNLTTADTWWVYFDKETHRLIAYMVQHADHFSYVKNLGFTKVGGFTFPKERKSWRVNPDRSIQYLRAEYKYEGYEVL